MLGRNRVLVLLLFPFEFALVLLVHSVGLPVEVCFSQRLHLFVGQIGDAEFFRLGNLTAAVAQFTGLRDRPINAETPTENSSSNVCRLGSRSLTALARSGRRLLEPVPALVKR
jgi:hypothetical protein